MCSRLPRIWRPRGPRKVRPVALTVAGGDPEAAVAEPADGVDGLAEVGDPAPLGDGGVAGVDPHDGEVAVDVVAGHGAGLPAAVGEGHGDLGAPQVVGVGDDGAGLDDDAAAPAPVATDADDGGSDDVGGLAGGVGGGRWWWEPWCPLVH